MARALGKGNEVSDSAQQPETPTKSETDQEKPQNQGIPYTLRRIQIIDGVILAAIIAVFSGQRETDSKVDQLLADRVAEEKLKAAEEKLEDRDPAIRKARYEFETNAIREHVRAVDGRVTELEKARRDE